MSFGTGVRAAAVIAVATAMVGQAHAAGFAITEQDGQALGSAFSSAAEASSASVVWYNPALMGFMPGTHVSSGASIILPFSRLSVNRAKTTTNPLLGGAPLKGGDGGNGGSPAFVPQFYLATEITGMPKLHLGLGVNVPFGLTTSYNDGWVGRYSGLTSRLQVINISPSAAYKINNWLSIGGGIDVQKLNFNLSNAVDVSSTCLGLQATGILGAGTCNALGGAALTTPQGSDAIAKLNMGSWSVGWNAGVAMQFNQGRTRLSLHYRSPVTHTVNGSAQFQQTTPGGIAFVGATGLLRNTDITDSHITLPESVNVSGFHQFNDHWAADIDVTWTRWSRIQDLAILFRNPTQPTSLLRLNYSNTWRVASSVRYKPTKDWTFRAGFAWDQSPQNTRDRGVRLPDNDRYWFTVGQSFRLSNVVQLAASYAFLYVKDAPLSQVDAAGNTVAGTFHATVHIISAQVIFKLNP